MFTEIIFFASDVLMEIIYLLSPEEKNARKRREKSLLSVRELMVGSCTRDRPAAHNTPTDRYEYRIKLLKPIISYPLRVFDEKKFNRYKRENAQLMKASRLKLERYRCKRNIFFFFFVIFAPIEIRQQNVQ